MSYTSTVTFVDTHHTSTKLIESGIWYYANGGAWSLEDGQGLYILEMGGSGTCGALRFKDARNRLFVVIVGFHNYEPWIDLLLDTKPNETTLALLPKYYNDGPSAGTRTQLLKRVEKLDSTGRKFVFEMDKLEGNVADYRLIIA